MRRVQDRQGFTLIEVLIAASILAVGLLALVSVFPVGYVDVTVSGGQSNATAYAQQMMDQLKNQPFDPGPTNGNDIPEANYTRTWNICPVGPPSACFAVAEPVTNPPNRLARITVTVNWAGTSRSQTVALETMRAE